MQTKQTLRQTLLKQRKNLTSKQVLEKSSTIKNKLFSLDIFKKAKNILFYYSFNNEVSTLNMISYCLKDNKTISLPVISNNNTIKPYIIRNLNNCLKKNIYNILEPDINICKEQLKDKINIVIAPGIAFDKAGNRLGFGKGYYDNFLKDFSAISIGLCYDFQLIDNVPVNEHDVPLNMVIST